ncbi:MAG: CZB domain-containing protein [Desulfobulbaceae bacterium]|nr:CZB domain-containing protein [Desulfobulbaceae bacterium]HIJ90588.1 CZB domain-containing protein [Deltaproteobacteria bacterium]
MIDITIARITHVEWVCQLEMLLHRSSTSVSLPSYHDCELGVWLYGEGLRAYKEIPEIGLLEKSHKFFHVAADNVLKWHNGSKFNSQKTAQAEIDFHDALRTSKEIVYHLTMLEFKMLQKYQKSQEVVPSGLKNMINHPWQALKSVIDGKSRRLDVARVSLDMLKKDLVKSGVQDSLCE